MAAELGIAAFSGIVTEVAKSLYQTIRQEICYVFKHQNYIKDLNNQVRELINKKEREQQHVNHAKRQGDEIHKDVDQWLNDVNVFIEQVANPITGNEGQATTCCFKGFCPSVTSRYKLGKKAVKAAKDGGNLLGKNFSKVSYCPPPQRTASMYVRDYEAFDSRESILWDILEALKVAKFNMIGVYGMGGVGKTTLVKKVAWQAMDYNLFDEVAIAEVTQKPDNRKIQEKIASDLGLEFGQHENEFDRARRLRNRLKKGKRVLVILDDIWAKPDFEAIGIPFGDDEKESALHKEDCKKKNDDDQRLYKILLTSRSVNVLRNDMNVQKNFPVKTLSAEEARNLFWKIVRDYHSAKGLSDFQTVAEIVGKCAGLPLAIATIANALKNKSMHVWEDALDKLRMSNPRSIPEMDERVVSVIELSFNLLQSDEAKKLFLLCSLIDSGRGTSYDYLLRYGMGWGLFQNVYTLEKGRNRLHMLIDNLKASCLLLEDDTNSWVKMHEFVHAVAISIASTSNCMINIQDVSDLNKVLEEKISENPTAISLPFRDISELSERLGCPELELFFLFMDSPSLQIPDSFFEGMKKLKVIDCNCINLPSLPSSFGYLTNLRTLCLDDCLLGDISTIGELKNLEILSFSGSTIEQLPREIGQLTRLQLLDLSDCSSLKVIPANVISKLSRLEELYLDNSSVQWENVLDNQEGSNANLAELNQLSRLTTLNICFLNAQIIPPNLFFPQLKRYAILIGEVWNWSHRNEASRTLKLNLNNGSYLGYKPIKILLKRTEDLFLDELNGIENVLYELDEEGFPTLKYLHVQNGTELLYIVNSAGQVHYNAFPMLEALSLNNLINLEKICHGPLKEASFNKLKTVKVNKCDGLKHLFSISMAKTLSQLQEIEVTDCENLKVIFAEDDDEGCVRDENESNSKVEFAQLRSLTLQRLPHFTSFSFNVKAPLISQTLNATNTASTEITTEDDHEDLKTLFGKRVEYPSLENLKLSSISIEKIWPEQLLSIASYCQTVKSLTLEGCNGLKFMFSSSMVKSFEQLQRLVLCNCESMEWVLDTKGLGGEESISFPKLIFLELKDLPELIRFGSGNIVEFPSLNDLIIDNCPNLRTFFSNYTCTNITVGDEPEEMNSRENLQADKQPLFGDKVGLPSLEVLIVYQMHNLRKIWDDQLSLDSFCKIKILRVEDCNKLPSIFPSVMLGRLERLENLEVMNCDSVEEIFELQALSSRKTLATEATQLRELHLCDLPSLKHVWNMDAQAVLSFENLNKIRVHNCRSLKSLFPAFMANGLFKLEELEIHFCLLEEIVAKDDKIEEAVIPRFMFPQLNSLMLHCLPKLKTFYPERHISEWPVLKRMEVSGCTVGCGQVKILASELLSLQQTTRCGSQPDHPQPLFLVNKVAFPSLEELKLSYLPELLQLWGENSQPCRVFQNLATLELSVCAKLRTLVPSSVSLWNLESLEVSKCDELINLLTLSTAKSLVNLTRINIVDCKMIEEFITHVGDEAKDDQIMFEQLKYLRLYQLPSLTRFCCLGSYAIKFPSLAKVIVGHCPKLVMLNKVHLKEGDDQGRWQDNLDTSRQQLFKEMVVFRGLKYLKISEFPQLKKIWRDQLLPGNVFCNLTSLVMDQCADMSTAISASLLQFLNNLEMLEVQNCDSLEQVFDLEELGIDGRPGFLCQLSHFYLIDLPRLSQICRRSHQEILGFKNLKFLEVQNCCRLRYIFTASIISGLKQLQEMKITNCDKMEVIIPNEGDEDADDKIVLPLLKSIILESLPDLTSFYSGSKILECPSLKTITITNCTKMDAFVLTSVKDLYLHTVPFFSDKVVLPALEKLGVSSVAMEMICHSKLSTTSCIQNLMHLDIDGCDNLKYLFPSSMVNSLVQLEELMISKCTSIEGVILMEEEGMSEMIMFPRLRLLRLQYLPSLKMFSNCTGNLTVFSSFTNLVIDKCSRMETFISNSTSTKGEGSEENLHSDIPLFDEKVSFPFLRTLIVCNMDNLRKIWDDDRLNLDSFSKLRDMWVGYCNKLSNIFPSIMHGRLQNLEGLKVWNCDSVEEIFKIQALSGQETNVIIATQLRELQLYHLPNLKHVWNMHNRVILGFQNLLSVQVHCCNNLESIFPVSIARDLIQLQVLSITSCMVDEIVYKEDEVEAVPRFMFPQLTSLTLANLPRLRCLYSGIHISEWPVLKQLMVSGCTEVEILASEFPGLPENHEESQHEISVQHPLFLVDKVAFPCLEELKLSKLPKVIHLWKENSQPSKVFRNLATLKVSECSKLTNIVTSSVYFHNLKILEVSKCDKLTSLVTSPAAKSLVQLTRMKITGCKSIGEMIRDSENQETDGIVFTKLEYLGLECLPSLRRFCPENYTLEFPSLDQVIVRECSKMETFSAGILRTPKLQRLQLTEREDGGRWEGDLNTTIQQMFKRNAQIEIARQILRVFLVLLYLYIAWKAWQ